jgi:V-type H+-transporting ATPase subunit C
VKDLNDVIVEPLAKEKDFIYTKFVTTLVCIVPAISIDEFLRNYELLTDNVIPYSAKQLKIPEKDALTLW